MITRTPIHSLKILIALGAAFLFWGLVLASPAHAATLTVNSTADTTDADGCTTASGGCTLREAIDAANTSSGVADTINFALGSEATITLDSVLPTITDSAGLTIDGGSADITISGNHQVQVFQVNSGANLTLTNLTVEGGKSGDFGGCNCGGGISNLGTLTVTNSTFSDNSATDFGGGIFSAGVASVATVSNSTFTFNSSLGGGGIATLGGSLTVNNSTFSDNRASPSGGGGILCDRGSFEGTHDTFTDNEGGSLVLDEDCSLGLSNTILANAEQGSNCSAPILDGGYNISDDASCAFSASTSKNSTNPRLHPQGLRHHGGPTHTIALLPNSPAIDAIPSDTNGCGTDVTTDQRGILRPQGPACDIGAFEVQTITPTEPPPDKRSCQKGGWKEFGFKNQGQCIKAVNQAS